MNYIHLNETIFQKSNLCLLKSFFRHCPFLDGLNPIAIKGIAISLQALINISLGFISCSFQVDNVILSADLAVIFFKYQTSSSSINRSSNGLLILLLKVSAMWTYLSVVLILLCPISSFTILMSVPCSSKWVANEWRSRCG